MKAERKRVAYGKNNKQKKLLEKIQHMKTKSLLIAITLLGYSSVLFADNCIDNLSKSIARIPEAQNININSFALNLLKPFSPELKGVKAMEILNADQLSEQDYKKFKNLITRCNSGEYETMVSTSEDDEMARILLKTEKDRIREMVIISLEPSEISLIRIKGNIDPKQMEELVNDNK